MRNKIIILISAIIIVVLGGGLFWWNSQNKIDHSNHEHNKESKATMYICPMHPQITSDEPGTCPICGMDLVLANKMDDHEDMDHQGSAESEGELPVGRTSLKLSLDKQQMIGVKLERVEEKKLFKTIKAPGRIAFDPELYTAQSEYLEALRQWNRVKDSPIADVRENSRQMIRSSKIRLKVLGLADDQIASLTKKGFQSEGLIVGGQDNIIYADVFEVDLPYIKEGQSAQISANFLQGKTLPGKVISVDQVINPETRTAKVRIKLLKNDVAIRPESYVNVSIFAPVGRHLAVSIESVMDTGVDTYIFLRREKGKFEPKKVQVVLETESEAAIVGDVNEGDVVVVGANFLIDSESRLKSVIQGGSASPAEHDH